ncbi:conserved exported hypothetical protein [Tenacibaculum sediminilitoris]|uniref:hypothetical protein n=1 Tax=Tenacibaculum sediminilitoris TaxID=1820334 RepID=UPI003892CF6F
MMSKKLLLLFSLISLFLFTSCFEFVEEVTFNKDGSGSAVLTINLSKSKTKLASMMLLDSVNGYKVPSKTTIKNKINEIVGKIQQTKGVHNVINTLNFNEFIVTVSCDFDNVEALNKVISNFSSKKQAEAVKKNQHFNFDKENKTFTRSHHFNLGKEFQKTKMQDRKVFETATYTSVYRFETPIRSSANNKARISQSKKAIMLHLQAQDIIANNQTIKNKIQLEN